MRGKGHLGLEFHAENAKTDLHFVEGRVSLTVQHVGVIYFPLRQLVTPGYRREFMFMGLSAVRGKKGLFEKKA